jgi:CheY-like chemotaxis protein
MQQISATQEHNPMRTDRATILLVDDEPNILELCRLYLETAQFRVVTAADGAGALEQVRVQRPDLVVLDLMLPDVDGWTATCPSSCSPPAPKTWTRSSGWS